MACKEVVISEANLRCSICFETYLNPRTLPCLHTFCHQCLSGYIEQLNNVNTSRGFNCPICRSLTLPPAAGARSEKWADQFPINFTLLSILNSKKEKMAERTTLCEPCERDNIDAQAVVYCFDCDEKMCTDCATCHRKIKASYKHNVGNIKETPVSSAKLNVLKDLMKCPNHLFEDVKFMCKDHDQLCCNDCAIVSHRKCDHIVSIAEQTNTYKGGEKASAIKEKLGALRLHANVLQTHETKQKETIDTSKETVQIKLAELKIKLENTYNEIERKIMEKSDNSNAVLLKHITKQVELIEECESGIVNLEKLLEIAAGCGNDVHFFLAVTKIEKEIKQYDIKLQMLQTGSTSETIHTVEKTSVDAIMESLKGCLEIEKQDIILDLPKCSILRGFTERVATFDSEFKCRHEPLKYHLSGSTKGCVFIDHDTVVVMEDEANSITLLNIKTQTHSSTYICSSQPRSIIAIGNTQVAVSLPGAKKIIVLNIDGLKMTCLNEILTKAPMFGLAYDKEDRTILASSREEGSISVLKLDGEFVHSIPLDQNTKNTVQQSKFIAFDSRSKVCYVSCQEQIKVIAINLNGQVVFDYQHPQLKHPWGIVLDADANLYVCSCISQCIHQVSRSGVFIRHILTSRDGLVHPLAMCFNKAMDKFVVTANHVGKEIKVYDFK